MKTAIEKLKELREHDSCIVAICKDYDDNVFYYKEQIPFPNTGINSWWSSISKCVSVNEEIEFESADWTKCISTYKDLENFEVETITISKSDYDRLIECEKKLNEIMKILEK